MSDHYQVLARKYRPHTFGELVGQAHAKKTLVNALDANSLHHGFLFTGTRGVGKTTIARIFAKSINCETGVSSTPCGTCATCIEIDKGQSIDLIELDAASHTGVDNMRDILENAQYMPTKNRYKIYLIDEVHMLSKSSFNALLKTLEEPPEHVKFLLATTDPKKLPVTVLSRCLQFTLQQLTHEEILGQLKFIMDAEKLTYEEPALSQIAGFGNGSMRDALSLLDQSISYGKGTVTSKDIKAMLGLVHHDDIITLSKHLFNQDAKSVIEFIKDLSHRGENLTNALKDLSSLFHQISLAQIIKDEVESDIQELADNISNQDLHIFYQMSINGTKDMALAPSEQIGFEMTLLRMLAFHSDIQSQIPTEKKTLKIKSNRPTSDCTNKTPATEKEGTSPREVEKLQPDNTSKISNQQEWEKLSQALSFSGGAKMLVKNTLFNSFENNTLTLALDEQFANLLNDHVQKNILESLRSQYPNLTLIIDLNKLTEQTLAQKETQAHNQYLATIQQEFLNDEIVQKLEKTFNAKVDVNSIREITKH
ncbi:DNA polymerase III subunits gamma and tau (EC 2.7.7.7) [uncultured Gammaproteobacteria bacterium]|uniref:DNA polymerase III subunit gamma/tau n=1 Tax=Bathymodiolus heckerae thiotrophic gill symbiont TaxID=1052212 RepID=UPI0010AFE7CB|nr:DNA polymerase III subunit gamma/tau [Bathymodiolus heckerae thiotrophic gill symbiont]CAC9538603.1 DNA polymerase III subunits gamma and tau (EC 2.7.7.7) [uncultured Gammaproteobacteria bacterium]CAC9952425.1 DNA polymerase III subunits gamma and tau (EC 2.7.7.7) [uncultured Gammaproteobacteria bacterium]CAC9965523.1 DNA polymerase III subunits gamma and tau (EC 2.7.7.7) [uncultured Gammaproteobacteria bacterium]SHN90257.1 DNA polymerase III subunits gamma and tau [Bathymodiolus heckerae th